MASTSGRGRAFWESTVREFEESDETQAAFAQRRGFSVAALRHWRLKLQREHEAGLGDEVRVVPVTITSSAAAAAAEFVEIGIGDVVLRVRAGTDAVYVAQLVAALRGQS